MPKIIISGCGGRMGHMIAGMAAADPDTQVAAGFDIADCGDMGFPVFLSPADCNVPADAVIDFSNPSMLGALLDFCVAKKLPVVLCTTGYSSEQKELIAEAAASIPIFMSANMSVGINLISKLVKQAAELLYPGFDVEIEERHHNQKLDAPSGTALMLADAAASGMDGDVEYVYGRHDRRATRPQAEIGISSLRGGNIPGEHSVVFAGPDEVIEIKHTVYSRAVFASGALRAAKFISGTVKPGFYDMSDVIG